MKIRGIITPVITPMHEDESINYEEFKNQINRQIDAGVAGVFCLGTNGEFYAMTTDEKKKVIKTMVEAAAGRVPVFAGTGCPGTKATIELSLYAKEAGADALSIIAPYFAAASQDEIYTHFKTIAEAVDMPIVLYNMPARAGNAIQPATVAKLADIPNIVGVKDSSGNFDNMLQYIELTRDKDFFVLSGNDALILWNLQAGGVGGIAGCANVYPHTLVSIFKLFEQGDFAGAKAVQDSIRPLRNVFKFGNPNTVVKKATKYLGYNVGECRAPFNQLSEAGMAALKKALDDGKEKGMK